MMKDVLRALYRLEGLPLRAVVVAVVGAATLLAGCAAQTTMGTRATMEDVRAMTAEIEQQRGVMGSGGGCESDCRIAASICDSANRICMAASELAEVEALQSCRRVESICIEARRQVSDTCTCP